MDFLFSRNPLDLHRLRSVLRPLARTYPRKVLFERSGSWGCLVSTGTHYVGLNPTVFEGHIILVAGDPLIDTSGTNAAHPADCARTEAIGAMFVNGIQLHLHHCSLIFTVDMLSSRVKVLSDAWGTIPAYFVEDARRLVIGSSPDLLAAVTPCAFDEISAIEKLCACQISFPNTLFREVKEIFPGTLTEFQNGGVHRATSWWTPPLPTAETSRQVWGERLADEISATLSKIENNVAKRGYITLSAGLDSRFLLSLASTRTSLQLSAINIASMQNISSSTAMEVARRFNIPFKTEYRREDHYSQIALSGAQEVGTNVCLLDAHFARRALGEIAEGEFMIGGFMADTLLVCGDPFSEGRHSAIQRKFISNESPRWAVNGLYRQIGPDRCAEISERWDKADNSLQIETAHSPSLSRIYPATRQGHKGHFDSARRNYPIYEPFMTERAVSLGFEIPDDIKVPKDTKKIYYGRYLEPTADIVVNPASGRKFRQLVRSLKDVVPSQLWPQNLINSEEWSEVKGPATQQLRQEISEAKSILTDFIKVDVHVLRRQRNERLILECVQALERCSAN